MSNQRYSEEFKSEAVRQVIDRGYSVKEVAERIGVCVDQLNSQHLIHVGKDIHA